MILDRRRYLLPSDANPDALLSTTCISGDELMADMEMLLGKVILLLDACNSGAIGRVGKKGFPENVVRELKSEDKGIITMCSSSEREESTEADGHGYFTKALIERLEGKAHRASNGVIYLSALDDYVLELVKDLSKGKQHPTSGKGAGLGPLPIAKP